ncbi:hypothetical protein BT63DRAFT_409878 [Microthyrium microscopicum]|uniref:Uncharacterized protein n=1 Tax=Microthyrium microscopicum TaxID=703497 RepID=A0A6A6UKJ3_9PEZI|nr:hypothetical protein BT63DRAFT_409878 [Microthyrium microscopicum]
MPHRAAAISNQLLNREILPACGPIELLTMGISKLSLSSETPRKECASDKSDQLEAVPTTNPTTSRLKLSRRGAKMMAGYLERVVMTDAPRKRSRDSDFEVSEDFSPEKRCKREDLGGDVDMDNAPSPLRDVACQKDVEMSNSQTPERKLLPQPPKKWFAKLSVAYLKWRLQALVQDFETWMRTNFPSFSSSPVIRAWFSHLQWVSVPNSASTYPVLQHPVTLTSSNDVDASIPAASSTGTSQVHPPAGTATSGSSISDVVPNTAPTAIQRAPSASSTNIQTNIQATADSNCNKTTPHGNSDDLWQIFNSPHLKQSSLRFLSLFGS